MKTNLLSALLIFSWSMMTMAHTSNSPVKAIKPTIQSITPKIDLNKASAINIAHIIKGIGLKRAQAIVNYRDQHFHFHSLEELAQVPGIGKRFVDRHFNEINTFFMVSPE